MTVPTQYYKDKLFIGKGLGTSAGTKTVFNIIRALIELPNNIIYLQDYDLSGIQRADEDIASSPFGRTITPRSFAMSEARHNAFILGSKLVKAVATSQQPWTEDVYVYRAYHIIRDGKLHTPVLDCLLGEETYALFHRTGILQNQDTYYPNRTYSIDLRNKPLISSTWANPRVLGLTHLLKEEQDLVSERTAFKKWAEILTARGENIFPDPNESVQKNKDADFLRHYKETPSQRTEETEEYTASFVTVRLNNYSPNMYVDWDAVENGTAPEPTFSYQEVLKNLSRIKKRLKRVRFISRSIVFAMEYTGSTLISWEEPIIATRGLKKQTQIGWLGADQLIRTSWNNTVKKSV